MIITEAVRSLIRLALAEDLSAGDITSSLTIPNDKTGIALVKIKEDCIICGLPLIEQIITEAGFSLHVKSLAKDGDVVTKGHTVAEISGLLSEILSVERTILNFLQRLSGCATFVSKTVASSNGLIICDTRKTTPGFRALEKYAVKIGGGSNHRFDLGQMVLVKDNHIDANGGDVDLTLKKVFTNKPPYAAVEVEVRNKQELEIALKYPINAIMLDNMSDPEVAESVRYIRSKNTNCLIEVSGGITPERIPKLSSLGAQVVSMGMLTNKYVSVDISLDIKL